MHHVSLSSTNHTTQNRLNIVREFETIMRNIYAAKIQRFVEIFVFAIKNKKKSLY